MLSFSNSISFIWKQKIPRNLHLSPSAPLPLLSSPLHVLRLHHRAWHISRLLPICSPPLLSQTLAFLHRRATTFPEPRTEWVRTFQNRPPTESWTTHQLVLISCTTSHQYISPRKSKAESLTTSHYIHILNQYSVLHGSSRCAGVSSCL